MITRFWAIADTHLSFGRPNDMARFGERWVEHPERIAEAWQALVAPDDVVLLPGDVSWAKSHPKLMLDLDWLTALPGRKVLLRGNHDHWWKNIEAVRKIVTPLGLYALEGDSITLDDVIICGAMGHIAPQDPYYVEDPKKDRYQRELLQTRSSAATWLRTARTRSGHDPDDALPAVHVTRPADGFCRSDQQLSANALLIRTPASL